MVLLEVLKAFGEMTILEKFNFVSHLETLPTLR